MDQILDLRRPTVHSVTGVAILAAVLAAAGFPDPWVTGLAPDGLGFSPEATAAFPAVAGTVPLLWLLRHPGLVLPVSGLLLTVAYVFSGSPLPLAVGLGVACFWLAADRGRSSWGWSLVVAMTPLIGLLVLRLVAMVVTEGPAEEGTGLANLGALLVVAAVVLGGSVGERLRTAESLRQERQARVASEERLSLAQDLHDGVGHGLAVIAMHAGAGLHVLGRDPERARASLEAIRQASTETLGQLRTSLESLTGEPRRTPARGLADLVPLLERIRGGGLQVTLDPADPTTLRCSEEAAATAYAVVQEALTNTVRHARATTVRVALRREGDDLMVHVDDDGTAVAPEGAGLGLAGLRQRVAALGGTFEAEAGEDGFVVMARIPGRGTA